VGQCEQLPQWPPAQPPQPPLGALLASMREPPSAPRLTAAKTEIARRAFDDPHRGHSAGASIWLMDLSVSKRLSHCWHWYS
jgi:hypothetical protein